MAYLLNELFYAKETCQTNFFFFCCSSRRQWVNAKWPTPFSSQKICTAAVQIF